MLTSEKGQGNCGSKGVDKWIWRGWR